MIEFRCTIAGCPRSVPDAEPFGSNGALGSHKRRRHGLVAVARRLKRPPGGTHRCDDPACSTLEPYQTAGGLGSHMRTTHGFVSEREDSVARRDRRHARRIASLKQELTALQRSNRSAQKLPPSPATTRHEPAHARKVLTSNQYGWLRLRLLYVLNGTWARELDMPPESLRDTIALMIQTNFATVEQTRRQRASR